MFHLHKDSLQDACGPAPPPLVGMQSWPTPLDLGVIAGGGVGQVITFEKEKARNRSGPAHTLIIRLVKVFSCNNASLGLSLSSRLLLVCACALCNECDNIRIYTQLLIN